MFIATLSSYAITWRLLHFSEHKIPCWDTHNRQDNWTSFMGKVYRYSVLGGNYRAWDNRTPSTLVLCHVPLPLCLESSALQSGPPQIVQPGKQRQLERCAEGW